MMIKVIEATRKPVSAGGAGRTPSEHLLREIDDWFAKEEATVTTSDKTGIEGSAGVARDRDLLASMPGSANPPDRADAPAEHTVEPTRRPG
jgi:hypothetical protein